MKCPPWYLLHTRRWRHLVERACGVRLRVHDGHVHMHGRDVPLARDMLALDIVNCARERRREVLWADARQQLHTLRQDLAHLRHTSALHHCKTILMEAKNTDTFVHELETSRRWTHFQHHDPAALTRALFHVYAMWCDTLNHLRYMSHHHPHFRLGAAEEEQRIALLCQYLIHADHWTTETDLLLWNRLAAPFAARIARARRLRTMAALLLWCRRMDDPRYRLAPHTGRCIMRCV